MEHRPILTATLITYAGVSESLKRGEAMGHEGHLRHLIHKCLTLNRGTKTWADQE